MEIQISIVIYNLIREICTGFLCKKHNRLPVRRGHAHVGGVYPPSGGRFPEVSGTGRGTRGNIFPPVCGGSLAFPGKAGIMVA